MCDARVGCEVISAYWRVNDFRVTTEASLDFARCVLRICEELRDIRGGGSIPGLEA